MQSLLAVFVLQVLSSNAADGLYFQPDVQLKARSVVDMGAYLKTCKQEPLELAIILDSSSSIHGPDFEKGKEFLQDFLGRFDISPREVRVSLITYGEGIYKQDGFNLTTYSNNNDVIEAIGAIPHRSGLRTDTGLAIQYMQQVQLAHSVVRPNIRKVSIVITDGESYDKNLTKEAAKTARDDNIDILAVGVGKKVNVKELVDIGGNSSQVIQVDNYESLPSIIDLLKSRTCTQIFKTTTPPPKTACGEQNPADVYFVFSPANLGPDATTWTTSFISGTINSKDLEVGFRYGVVSGSCPDDEGFDLGTYSTVSEYRERLNSYQSNKLPQLLQRLRNDGYSSQRGGSSKTRKVAVVVTNTGKDTADLASYVEDLRNDGVQVFTADPAGKGGQIDGATALYGSSARHQSESLVTYLCPPS